MQAVRCPAASAARAHTILTASGGVSGTPFAGLDVTGSFRPARAIRSLNYDASDVYLVLDPGELIAAVRHQRQPRVADAINRAVLGGATPPAGFNILFNLERRAPPSALTQSPAKPRQGRSNRPSTR